MKAKTRSPAARRRRLTIIVIRNFGKIRTFELSSRWITAVVVLFVCLSGAVALLAFQNHGLRMDRQRLLAQVFLPQTEAPPPPAKTETETTAETAESAPSGQAPAESEVGEEPAEESIEAAAVVVEATAGRSQPESAAETEPTTTTTTTSTSTTTTTTTTTTAVKIAVDDAERIDPKHIEVKGLKILRLSRPNGIKVSYKILNRLGGGKRISGYTFIVAKNTELSPPLYKPFPQSAILSQNRPVNHKQGVYFSIYQFKTIRGRIYDKAPIKSIDILVYDKKGRLVLSRSFEVPHG